MQLVPVVLAALASLSAADVYVPGEPGGPWSSTELLIVKAKLRQLYHRSHNAPKALRLGFHDCLLYTDGTGGCDGCLNWSGVDVHHYPVAHMRNLSDHHSTDNNGLGDVVRKLERIYTETNYPHLAPSLSQSLRDTGKSRADLWAYAAIVAVEWGIQANNWACDNSHDTRLNWGDGRGTCVHDSTEPGCKITLPRAIQFQTGRADCTEHETNRGYVATRHEHHPSYLDNGRRTVEFFKKDFNMTGREVVAIFGAHTYGKPHFAVSQVPYTWTSRAINLFNNDYYKSMTGQDRWYFNEGDCNKVGDAFGNKPKSKWIAHTRMTSRNGGPTFWIHHNHACPNCADYQNQNRWTKKNCCGDNGDSYCRPDPALGGSGPRSPGEEDGDDNRGCEKLRFISGADEIALNCEMGLYLDFEVDNGVLYGCSGLEIFNQTMSQPLGRTVWSTRANGKGIDQPGCAKQTMAEPPGSTPLYQIMDEYADNQDAWIRDFIPTLEKMLANGYPNGLSSSEDHYTNIACPVDLGWKPWMYCYQNQTTNGEPFMIESRWDALSGRVLEMDLTTHAIRMLPETGATNQQWVLTDSMDSAINVATGLPFVIKGNVHWEARQRDAGGVMLINSVSGEAVDCYGENNGHPCTTWREHGAPWQQFNILSVATI